MRLTIRPNENVVKGRRLIGAHYRYWLDDLEVTDSLSQLQLEMGREDANLASITLFIDDVEVDAEFLAALEAHVRRTA